MEKYKKSHTKIIKLKYQLQHGLKSSNYLMDHIMLSDIQDYFKYIFKKT